MEDIFTVTVKFTISVSFLSRCDRGVVQPHPLRQPAGAEVQTAGGSDSGRCGGGHTDRGRSRFYSCLESQRPESVFDSGFVQDETDTTTERKNDLKSAPLENGLSPASGPAGHTPVATTPKAAAANQQAASTGILHHEEKHSERLKCTLNVFTATAVKNFHCVFSFLLFRNKQTSSKD